MKTPNLELENFYLNNVNNINPVIFAGVDEAGRGPLAGPVVAAAVIFDAQKKFLGVRDSKLLTSKQRNILFKEIINNYQYGVGIASVEEIDQYNILEATKLACQRAVKKLPLPPTNVVIDGNMNFSDPRYVSLIKADQSCYSVAASSIIAKVTRDKIMSELDLQYPNYGWKQNCGYGTRLHIEAIKAHGYTIHHRRSFQIKN